MLNQYGLLESYKSSLEIFLWLARRQTEITLFKYLQDSANRLSSMSPIARFNMANVLTKVLFLGIEDMFQSKGSFLVSKKIQIHFKIYLTSG
jgi:hypothetical protein